MVTERHYQVVERQTQVPDRRSGPFQLNLTTDVGCSDWLRWYLRSRARVVGAQSGHGPSGVQSHLRALASCL